MLRKSNEAGRLFIFKILYILLWYTMYYSKHSNTVICRFVFRHSFLSVLIYVFIQKELYRCDQHKLGRHHELSAHCHCFHSCNKKKKRTTEIQVSLGLKYDKFFLTKTLSYREFMKGSLANSKGLDPVIHIHMSTDIIQ